MLKNEDRSIFVTLYKAQVQEDQGPPHKTRYIETYIEEGGEEPEDMCTRKKNP